jgi:peptide methionine sulfoxide reductase MsrA
VQAVFEHIKGVTEATSGYTGGYLKSPTYEAVSLGVTGHAESVQSSSILPKSPTNFSWPAFPSLTVLKWNRQGPNRPQYRSEIFLTDQQQKRIAESYIQRNLPPRTSTITGRPKLENSKPYRGAYHRTISKQSQQLLSPINDLPKLANLRKLSQSSTAATTGKSISESPWHSDSPLCSQCPHYHFAVPKSLLNNFVQRHSYPFQNEIPQMNEVNIALQGCGSSIPKPRSSSLRKFPNLRSTAHPQSMS